MKNLDLRKEIDRFVASNSASSAARILGELWRAEAGPSTAGFVVSRYEQLRRCLNLASGRLFIPRSFTVEPVVPLLRAAGFVNGIDLVVQVGDFNAYVQEILDQDSRLYSFAPDVAILAVQTRDVAPALWDGYAWLTAEEAKTVVEGVVANFRDWVLAFRSNSQAALVLHTLEAPPLPAQGILDSQLALSQVSALQQINQQLRCLAAKHPGVYVLDYDALVARYGRTRWYDESKWLTMRLPIAADHLIHLANEWLRFVHPLVGRTCKALVTDLDNTLWGGVIGEDGMEGIQLGSEYPGAAFQAVQRVMLDFYERGILLAVCTKNNLADAIEALDNHPGMLLRPEHFAALRINWRDKAENLREIAAELNIGIDALAFLDDNAVERERIRSELPEVTVIELPDEPMEFARVLRNTPVFERLGLTEEDKERGRYYAEQRQRVEFEHSASTLEDFYKSLTQEVKIAPASNETLVRVAQLTQKTNQFNLTTRRYSEQQIAELVTSVDWRVYTASVTDRFGDNGLVSVIITRDSDEVCDIDTFLMSCRVVGRTVETAILSFLAQSALSRGMKRLQGWYIPTKKNELVKDFYRVHHFEMQPEHNGRSLWSIDLEKTSIACPEWISLVGSATKSL